METKPKKKAMVGITINIPELYLENIEKLIGNGFASRSEVIRIAIYNFLQKEFNIYKLMGYFGEGN